MQYQHRCSECSQLFVSPNRYHARCPKHPYSASNFVVDVAEAAIDTYIAMSMIDVAGDVIGGAASAFGSLFD